MKYKEKLIKIAKPLVFFAILICMVNHTSRIMESKTSIDRMGAFYEESDKMDVLFFGTSHVRYTILPMELWNQHGMTSHNMGASFATQVESYWYLINALDYAKPDLVVLDAYKIADDDKSAPLSFVHAQLDAMPMSINKLKAIFDLKDKMDARLELIWDLYIYHDRWTELGAGDFMSRKELANKVNRGSTPRDDKIGEPASYPKIDRSDKLEDIDTLGMEYLRKFIEECQSNGIDILLVFIPFPADENKQREANTIYDIAKEYGVQYVNLLDTDVINYETDCVDYNSHLNLSGALKVTDYIGNYIMENYNITDHRGDAAYSSWNDNFEEYMANKIDAIKETAELDAYLMKLADKNLSSCIYIDEDAVFFQREKMVEMLRNVSQNVQLEKLEEAVDSGSIYFLIIDNSENTAYEIVGSGEIDIPNTTFGHVEYGIDDDGNPYLYIQDGEKNYLEKKNDVMTVCINKYTGEIKDSAQFVTYGRKYYGMKIE